MHALRVCRSQIKQTERSSQSGLFRGRRWQNDCGKLSKNLLRMKVDLGYGVFVNAQNLQFVSKNDLKKTTYMACEVGFTQEELSSSSLTGKKTNAFKDATVKQKLDENSVSAVLDFVRRLRPGTDENDVKKTDWHQVKYFPKAGKRKELRMNTG